MKKKVLLMVINMNIGGTERALLNLIHEMPEDKYDITVYMLEKRGGFLEQIPERVNIKCLDCYANIKGIIHNPPKETLVSLFQRGKYIKGMILFIIFLICKLSGNNSLLFHYLLRNVPSEETTYDIAVAYAGPMDFISFFVAKKMKAKRKIQWIHFDVTKIGFNKKFASSIYQQFHNIYAVSREGKEKLMQLLPTLKNKIDVFPNVISPYYIVRMSKTGEGFKDNFDGIRILTVGRLSKEKGQDLAISVLKQLKDEGFHVRWYCIGEGGARLEYEKQIAAHKLEDDFLLLGSTPNPYPYMKQSDIYVQPSRHEGYCITLAEAKMFNKPIISTNFTGANEQLSLYPKGYIVNFDQTELYNQLKLLINTSFIKRKNYFKEKV
jgi:glycosyltransferase involved in cell wall biosynthesis